MGGGGRVVSREQHSMLMVAELSVISRMPFRSPELVSGSFPNYSSSETGPSRASWMATSAQNN